MNSDDQLLSEAWIHNTFKPADDTPKKHPTLAILDHSIQKTLAKIKGTTIDDPKFYFRIAELISNQLPVDYPAEAVYERMLYLRKNLEENLGPIGATGTGDGTSGTVLTVGKRKRNKF